MSGPDWQAERERVLTIATRVQNELQLNWLYIKHLFDESEHDYLAETQTKWEYRQAEVTWCLPSVIWANDEAVEDVVIHEYIHILMAPLDEHLTSKPHVVKLNEFVVESLARVVQAARRGTI